MSEQYAEIVQATAKVISYSREILEHPRRHPNLYNAGQQPSEKMFRAALAGAIAICQAGYGDTIHIVQAGNHIHFDIDGQGVPMRMIKDMIYHYFSSGIGEMPSEDMGQHYNHNTSYPRHFTTEGAMFFLTVAWSSEFQCYNKNRTSEDAGMAFREGKFCPFIMPDDDKSTTGFCIDFTFDANIFKGKAIDGNFVEMETRKIAARFPRYPITLNGKALNGTLENLIGGQNRPPIPSS